MKKMELDTIIRSLNELEKLKLLLFDDNQLFLFEHVPKPFLMNQRFKQDIYGVEAQGLKSLGQGDYLGNSEFYKNNHRTS